MNRSDFLKLSGFAGVGFALSACGVNGESSDNEGGGYKVVTCAPDTLEAFFLGQNEGLSPINSYEIPLHGGVFLVDIYGTRNIYINTTLFASLITVAENLQLTDFIYPNFNQLYDTSVMETHRKRVTHGSSMIIHDVNTSGCMAAANALAFTINPLLGEEDPRSASEVLLQTSLQADGTLNLNNVASNIVTEIVQQTFYSATVNQVLLPESIANGFGLAVGYICAARDQGIPFTPELTIYQSYLETSSNRSFALPAGTVYVGIMSPEAFYRLETLVDKHLLSSLQ